MHFWVFHESSQEAALIVNQDHQDMRVIAESGDDKNI